MNEVVLVAASGLAREAVSALRAAGRATVAAVLDDDPARWGTDLGGARVVGGLEDVKRYGGARVLVCAGRGTVRRALVERLAGLGVTEDRFTTVLHPRVEVPDGCTVGAGSILLAGTVLTADVSVGRHVVAMPRVTLTHDDRVEDFATLCAGVTLGGGVTVGEAAYVGMNASVRENLTVGPAAVLGMGSVLLRDQPAGETWVGVPATAMSAGAR